MKLYDYSKRQNKKLKDKQWDWVDEEFRRLWDVVYNQREQYPKQIKQSATFFNTDPKAKDGVLISGKVMHNGATGAVAIFSSFVLGGAANVQSDDFEANFLQLGASSLVNSVAQIRVDTEGSTGDTGFMTWKQNPYFRVYCKTGSSIVNERVAVGFHLIGNYTFLLGFVFDQTNHPKWAVRADIDVGGVLDASPNEPLGATNVTVDTQYVLEMQVIRTNTNLFDVLANVYEEQVDQTTGQILKSGEEFKLITGLSINDPVNNENAEVGVVTRLSNLVAGTAKQFKWASTEFACFKGRDVTSANKIDPYQYVQGLVSNIQGNVI